MPRPRCKPWLPDPNQPASGKPGAVHIAGAVAVLRHARNRPTRDGKWVRGLLARKPTKVTAVALAKTARIVWAVMARGGGYRAKAVFGQPA